MINQQKSFNLRLPGIADLQLLQVRVLLVGHLDELRGLLSLLLLRLYVPRHQVLLHLLLLLRLGQHGAFVLVLRLQLAQVLAELRGLLRLNLEQILKNSSYLIKIRNL